MALSLNCCASFRLAGYLAPRRSARGRRLYREDFFLAFPGIIFLTARFVVFAADLAAFFTVRTERETTDFFFALLAIVISRFSIWIF
jgi:hypothetical protein